MLVSATLRLLTDHGQGVTTRQIAEAAGVAEGTIFRAFPDKDSLIDAAIEAAFNPASLEVAIAAIDPTNADDWARWVLSGVGDAALLVGVVKAYGASRTAPAAE